MRNREAKRDDTVDIGFPNEMLVGVMANCKMEDAYVYANSINICIHTDADRAWMD